MLLRDPSDLEKLLIKAGIPESQRSSWLSDEHQEALFATLAFFSIIWTRLVNPNRPQTVARGPAANAPSKAILQSWLAKGITAEEIAAVVRDFQLDAVYAVLQTIEQLEVGAGQSIAGFTLWAHDANDEFNDQIPRVAIDQFIVDLFMRTKPADQPPVEQYV